MDINVKLRIGEPEKLEALLRNISEGNIPEKKVECDIALQVLEISFAEDKNSSFKPVKETLLKNRLAEILREMGIKVNLYGFQYIREAVILAVGNPKMIRSLTKELYPAVAKKFDVRPTNIERGIRHAIESAWYAAENGNELRKISNNKKPTNGCFLAYLVEKIRVELEE